MRIKKKKVRSDENLKFGVFIACPTICTDGIIIYDPSPGAECFRRVHSSELMRMHGMPTDFDFPAHFTEAQKVRLIGLGMGGCSILALCIMP